MDFSFRFVGNSDKTLNKVGGEFDQFGWEVVTLEGGGGGGGGFSYPPPPPPLQSSDETLFNTKY